MAEKQRGLFFNLLIFLILGFIGGICIANAVYFGKIRNEKNDSLVSLSTSGAGFLMWINIIFGVLALIVAIWYLFKVLIKEASRKAAIDLIYEKSLAAYRKYDESGGLFDINRLSPRGNQNSMNGMANRRGNSMEVDLSNFSE